MPYRSISLRPTIRIYSGSESWGLVSLSKSVYSLLLWSTYIVSREILSEGPYLKGSIPVSGTSRLYLLEGIRDKT